jgi:hypothetical protein
MRGAYTQYLKQKGCKPQCKCKPLKIHPDLLKEESAELRRARIQNGAEPDMKNGK